MDIKMFHDINIATEPDHQQQDEHEFTIDHIIDFRDSFEAYIPTVDPAAVHIQDSPDMTEIELQRYERGPPDRNPLVTAFNFVVEVNSTHTDKKKYLYSHKLNRIYVDMNVDFSVQFDWVGASAMYVRAAVVFADVAQAEKRVERCTSHYHETINKVGPVIAKNVLHSSRGSLNSPTVQYCGSAHEEDSWLSVRVALTKKSSEPATHAFRFKCKNSCTSGINRRAIAVIFTLEDIGGNVYGRQIVGARVCACPRRDMLRDERTEDEHKPNKRRITSNDAERATKVKLEDCDDALVHLPNLQLLSPASALLGLEAMIKMEEQALESRQDSLRPTALRVITQLKQTRDEVKRKYNVQ